MDLEVHHSGWKPRRNTSLLGQPENFTPTREAACVQFMRIKPLSSCPRCDDVLKSNDDAGASAAMQCSGDSHAHVN